jgi:TolB protein
MIKNFTIIFSLLLLLSNVANAQWTNRYPKVDGYGHHVYLEGHELPVLNSGPTDPAPSPSNDQVVFSAKGWLWIMELKTLEAKRVTFSSGMDYRPNWSPDGQKIVFVRDNGLDMDIVVLDLMTKKESILVDSKALDMDPIFSANGREIYYTSAKNGSFDLWKIDLSTLASTLLTNENSLERLPVPTFQGDHIVYLKKTGFSYDSIELLELESGTSSPLVEENFVSQAAFSLSPDNKTLAYTWPDGDDYELRLLDITIPKSKVLLTKSEGLPLSPKFSFDGQWVYFSENGKNESSAIKRIPVYGGSPEVLSVRKWDWAEATGKVKITSTVDGIKAPVRMSILAENGHPIVPETGIIHSEGQHGIVFFYSPGEIEVEAPLGTLKISAVHGFSTPKVVQEIKLEAASATTEINLNRIWDANKAGWYAADNHFHLNYGGTNQLDPEDILLDLKAEEIAIAFPLVANLGNRFLEQDLFGWKNEEMPILSFGQEVRSHFLGHLNLIGTEALYWPWVWGPGYDIYGAEDRLNAAPLRFAREKGGLGGYVHPVSIRDPFEEGGASSIPVSLIADAVLGEVDILELGCLWTDEIGTASVWHEFLNLGIPVALSAGSDVMNDLYRTMAIGATRVYVKPEGKLTEDTYLAALKKGKSFVTNGPQLLFSVEGSEVGEVIASNKRKADWEMTVHSPISYEKVEIFVNGEVVWTGKSKGGNSETYSGSIKIPNGGWVTARVSGSKSEWPMMDSYVFAESSPLWFAEIGSTLSEVKSAAASKLIKALDISEERMKQGYGDNQIPLLTAHFSKARQKLADIVSEGRK